jgi:two-component system, OmpR family, sensor kinase
MVRRLVFAILGVTITALAVSWLGLVVLSRGAARDRSVDELTDQVLVAATVVSPGDDDVSSQLRILVDLLELDDAAVLRVDPASGDLIGRLPDALRQADLDAEAFVAGRGRSGTRGDTAFVAVPIPPTQSADGTTAITDAVVVLVLTRTAKPQPGVLNGWLALTSVVALAVGTAVALGIAGRISRPVSDASAAAGRIAAGERGVRLVDPGPGRDDDELVQLARSVNEMAETIEQSDDLERQFLVSVSHDLRTPLTSIRGYAEAIADGSITDLDWATSVIRREADRLDRLIRDLLDLARLDARSFSIESVPVDMIEMVQLSVEMLMFRATDAGLELHVELPGPASEFGRMEPLAAMVAADPDRLLQIIGNLIDNALKYASSSVVVSVDATDMIVRVHVDDDGPGIAEHEWASVFERHFTASNVQQRGEQGTGLGLALVVQLAEAFGGSAAAMASPAGGARLTVSLPSASGPADRESSIDSTTTA